MIEINNNFIKIDDIEIKFEAPIAEYVEYKDLVIVVLDYKSQILRNIYAINRLDGGIKWQVEGTSNYVNNPVPFTVIRIIDNELVTADWSSWRYVLDPYSGKIIQSRQGK